MKSCEELMKQEHLHFDINYSGYLQEDSIASTKKINLVKVKDEKYK